MKEHKSTLWQAATNSAWKRTIIILAFPLLVLGAFEVSYQARVSKLTTALGELAHDLGGVNEGLGVSSHCTHSWDAFGAIDTGPCPLAGGTVWVAVSPGEQLMRATNVLKQEGYDSIPGSDQSDKYSTVGGTKNGVGLSIEMIVADSHTPKQTLPEGKKWVRFNIRAEEVN